MNESIGTVLGRIREEKNLSRKQVCDGLMSENEYRTMETGKSEGTVWQQRLLLGRLRIPEPTVVYYLSPEDNEMVNLETEIYRRMMTWKYETAEEKLQWFYEMADKTDVIQMLIYYRLYLLVYGHRNKMDRAETEVMQDRLGSLLPELEFRLQERECLSPEELAFLTEYYSCCCPDIYERSERLYEIMDYCKNEYKGEENRNRFYAQLCYYYAGEQYMLKQYQNCIRCCNEGLKVTALFGNCNNTAELLELLAYTKDSMWSSDKNKEFAKEIMQQYETASRIYAVFYGKEAEERKKVLEEKITQWKTMQSQ